MSKRNRINELIQLAMVALENARIASGDSISDEYKGHINALGATILQSGLLPALIYYNKDKKDKCLKALYYMEYKTSPPTEPEPNELIKKIVVDCNVDSDMGTTTIGTLRSTDALKAWESRLLDYSVALKLASRSFVFKDRESL